MKPKASTPQGPNGQLVPPPPPPPPSQGRFIPIKSKVRAGNVIWGE